MRAALRYAWLGVLGCAHAPNGHATHLRPPSIEILSPSAIEPPEVEPKESMVDRARGVGTMTARVPGTTTTVDNAVRLSRHHVRVEIRDGLAHTEIDEEFTNEANRVLEGRYVFAAPQAASISRLALEVNEKLIEGEIVDLERAREIYTHVVDNPHRPRDPALLEKTHNGNLSLRVFPIEPLKSRRVIVGYDEPLARDAEGLTYRLPISLGRADASIDDFRVTVRVRAAARQLGFAALRWNPAATRDGDDVVLETSARMFRPRGDLALLVREEGARPETGATAWGFTATPTPTSREPGYFAVRWTPAAHVPPPPAVVFVIDRSVLRSRRNLDQSTALVVGLARRSRAPFAVLACDGACESVPESGTLEPGEESAAIVARRIGALKPRGSFDLAGALRRAAEIAPPGARVVLAGEGSPSSGERSAETVAAAVRPALRSKRLDLRVLGTTAASEDAALARLARAVDATFDRLDASETITQRIERAEAWTTRPLLRDARLTLPASLEEPSPVDLGTFRLGDEHVAYGRARTVPEGDVVLTGTLDGKPFSVKEKLRWTEAAPNALFSRLWASARIEELERVPDRGARIVALSKQHHVLSKLTSMLVLENDAMFEQYGVARTASDRSDAWGMQGIISGDLGLTGVGAGGGGPASMWGTSTGDAFGAGGLGSVGGIGRGAGSARSAAPQGLGGGHAVRTPALRAMAVTVVSGRLPAEVIQRIVRQNFGRFRLCYESGLRRDPSLAGRVVVKFIIDTDGSVRVATVSANELRDEQTGACVARAFTNLAFPQPEGGVVTVVYPIVFSTDTVSAGSLASPFGNGQVTEWIARGWAKTKTEPSSDEWRARGEAGTPWDERTFLDLAQRRSETEQILGGLLSAGFVDRALADARRWSIADAGFSRAHWTLARAAAFADDAETRIAALDAAGATAPEWSPDRLAVARSLEIAGDERRACAHWRTLAEQAPYGGDARYQALRCRARLGDAARVVDEGRVLAQIDPRVAALIRGLQKGDAAPTWASGAEKVGGDLEARLVCPPDVRRCPEIAVVAPSLGAWSRAAPGAPNALVPSASPGRYYTVALGGDPDARGALTIKTPAGSVTLQMSRGDNRTIAVTTFE